MLLVVIFIMPLTIFANKINFSTASVLEIQQHAAQEGKLYFLYFSANWCAPCKWMDENTFNNQTLAEYSNNEYLAVQLDIDNKEAAYYQDKYSVTSIPSILIFSARGDLLQEIGGSIEAKDLLAVLKQHNHVGNKRSAHHKEEVVLESPKPIFKMEKPALVTEESKQQMHEVLSAPMPQIAAVETASPSRTNVFIPKSGEDFYYMSVQQTTDYATAIDLVKELEAKFNNKVQVFTHKEGGQLLYEIAIGQFFSKSKAHSFLNYMNRNDISGSIKKRANVNIVN